MFFGSYLNLKIRVTYDIYVNCFTELGTQDNCRDNATVLLGQQMLFVALTL